MVDHMVEHMANPLAYIKSLHYRVWFFRIRVPIHLQPHFRHTWGLVFTANKMQGAGGYQVLRINSTNCLTVISSQQEVEC